MYAPTGRCTGHAARESTTGRTSVSTIAGMSVQSAAHQWTKYGMSTRRHDRRAGAGSVMPARARPDEERDADRRPRSPDEPRHRRPEPARELGDAERHRHVHRRRDAGRMTQEPRHAGGGGARCGVVLGFLRGGGVRSDAQQLEQRLLVRDAHVSAGLLPSLKTRTVGTPRMPNLDATPGESSMSSLPTLTLPLYSSASFSTIGARTLQGPHQTALKSRRKGTPDLSTSVSKFTSLISRTFAPAMGHAPFSEYRLYL